jgi:hypothetical protein
MRYISFIIIAVMIATVPVKYLLAQDQDSKAPGSESWFESEWEHNEQESLSKLPADLREDLLKVKEVDLEQYGELLHEAAHSQYDGHFRYAEESEKERYETEMLVQQLELQTEALSIQFEHAKDSEKNGIISKLKTKLDELFEMKEKERALNIKLLEKELTELKESLSVRKQHKTEIINRRLNELIGRDDYFEW